MIRFGEFTWDPRAEALRRAGVPIPLQPKTARLLDRLLASPGRLWTREELDREVWPDVTVTDDSLTQAVRRLRTALGDERQQARFLETVPRRGYRWIGAIAREGQGIAPAARPSPIRPDGALYGRAEDLARVQETQGRARLVTIVGPAGIGKTRLALELAPAAVCGLGAVSDAAGLTAAMVDGLALAIDGDPVASIRAAIAEADGWVLLDEAEAALERTATAVAGWLASSDRVRILVTSRSRLGLAAEHCVEIGPLGVSDGAALYRDRSRAVEPGAMDGDADVNALVDRLGGIPLAIELAAARRPLLSPGEVRERLDASLAVLTLAQADRPARHRSMADALAWSWSLLTPEEQRAAAIVSRFVGGMSVAAAERALAGFGDPLGVLEALRHRSWLQRAGDRMELYTLVRDWLAEQRATLGLEAESACRHVRAMVPFFDAHRFDSTAAYVAERENLWSAFRAADDPASALALCRSLVRLERAPPYDAVIAAIDRVLALADEDPLLQAHALTLRALVGAGIARDAARADAERALALAGADPDARAWASIALAQLLPMGHDGTLPLLDEAIRAAREAGDVRAEAEGFGILGHVLVQRGACVDADAAMASAVALLPASFSRARLQVSRARAAAFAWDLAAAHACALEALDVLHPRHDAWLYGRGLLVLATVAAREGRFADADALLDQVEALGPVAVRFAPYEVVRSRTQWAVAAGDLDRARGLLAGRPPPPTAAVVVAAEDEVGRVAVLVADGAWAEATDVLSRHAELFHRVEHRLGAAICHLQLAVVASLSGDHRRAARSADLAAGLVDPQMGPHGAHLVQWLDAIEAIPEAIAGGPRATVLSRLDHLLAAGPLGPTTRAPTADATTRILATAVRRALQ